MSLLEKCVHVRYVDISANALTDISALNALPELCSLTVAGNQLAKSTLSPRKYLQVADFSGNQLTTCDSGFEHPMLAKLTLAQNKLETLADLTTEKLPALTQLDARENAIATVASLVLPTLTHLFLDGNKLLDLVGISSLVSLRHLSARQNQIKTLDGFSEAQAQLATIDLGTNQVAVVAEADKLACLKGLETLVLAENPVSEDGEYRAEVLIAIGELKKLDEDVFEEDDRIEANTQREKRKADALEAEEAGGDAPEVTAP